VARVEADEGGRRRPRQARRGRVRSKSELDHGAPAFIAHAAATAVTALTLPPKIDSPAQGCQMVYFRSKNANFGVFWKDLGKKLVYFLVIWYFITMLFKAIWYFL
jgi:hypothetical protein